MTVISVLQTALKPSSYHLKKPKDAYSLPIAIIALAIAYVIAAKLSYFSTVPPGYASAIWPAAGIALAGLLVYGNRVWPGVWLGSLIANGLIPDWTGSTSDILMSLLITLVISSGASLQALAGAYALKRYAGYPNGLISEKSVLLFMLYGGVLSTLINSSLSVSLLVATGKTPLSNALNNWLTWWSGDLLGVMLFTPLALAWLLKNTDAWRHRRLAITLPILAMLALTASAIVYEARSSNERIQLEFDLQTKNVNNAIKVSLDNDIHILGALKNFFLHSEVVSREEFKLYTEDLLKDYQDIQAMSWNPLIKSAARDAFEKSMRLQGFPNFQIYELDSNKQAIRAKDRASYVPIAYTEPLQGNEKALGFDISSNPIRLSALNIATDSGELTLTSRIKLVQDKSQYSVLALMPLYAKHVAQLSLEEKRSAILGYIVGIIRTHNVIASALKQSNTMGLSYRLLDSSAPADEQLLYSSDETFPAPLVIQEKAWFSAKKTLSSRIDLPIGGRVWTFEIVPKQDYFATHYSGHVWLVMLLGLLLTGLVTLIALIASGRARRLQQLISESTAELKQQHALALLLMQDKENLHQRLNLILNATGEGIFGIDLNGECIFMNSSALRLLGYASDQEVLGKNNHQLIHYAHADGSHYQAQQCPIYKALHGESNASIDTEVFWRKDGTSFPVQYESHPIIENEIIIGCVVNFMDISVRKHKEKQLIAAKERAENLAKTKSQFLANMSHEIRTPMNAIIGFSELALLKDMPADIHDYLKNINTASNNLLVILNDILDLSKLEAGQMILNLRPFSVHDLKNTLHNLFINAAQSKGLAFNITLASDVPGYLIGDDIRLRQVLTNLLGNALKFTQQGAVTLNISLQQANDQQVRLLFAVTDTGIGISTEQQAKLFKAFSQVDDGYNRNFEGTGLGLVISQDLVQMMNGTIKADSLPGSGSCFSFELTLPIAATPTSASLNTPASSSPSVLRTETKALEGIKILVAEDDVFNQKIIQQVLKRLGASLIVLANNGSEVLSALEQEDFDVLLMDLHMPIMNGYETTAEIRKRPQYAQLPVIALSASITEEDRQQSLAVGMNDFIGKPIKVNALLSTLELWLKRER